jgi:hypothetical protein
MRIAGCVVFIALRLLPADVKLQSAPTVMSDEVQRRYLEAALAALHYLSAVYYYCVGCRVF